METSFIMFQQQSLEGYWTSQTGNRRKNTLFEVLKYVVWMFYNYWFVLQRNSLDKKPDFNNGVRGRQTDNDGGQIYALWSEHRRFQSDWKCTESAERHQKNQRLSFRLIMFHSDIFVWTPQTVCSANISFCSVSCSWCCCFSWF